MSVIADFSTGMEGLVLEQALQRVDARLEVEQAYATDPDHPILFFWATCDDPDALEAAMDEDPTVTNVHRLSEVDGRRLYRVRLTEAVETILYTVWVELGGEGVEAEFRDGRWYSKIRFPDRGALREYEAYVTANDLHFELHRVYDASEDVTGEDPPDGLTESQRETLLLAYERGFFDIPRRATAAELAEELGVSRQAVSERLRRAYATLVEEHVV
ncbi:helix-turn-helix domain-containing protein [Salinirubellus salinus]|uniref:Helix-turn-helix domain-containing protein n=1 Tax=Salinirubellus salinus TaxID=1364945 RepID=A0A9E7U5F2_9EURY|nr:helix-turn-helix domain-containing protein [Salinirubellus salinus]UWM55335.1 helix-turn-helix domain-containing protein [Salinirubellus salinus]